MSQLDYLDHLSLESARFAEALRDAPAGARVPTCPDWDADDLLWHLGEVQWFWGQIASGPITSPADVEALEHPERPDDRAGLERFYADSTKALQHTLADTPPETTAWSWAPEQTTGFIRRRQAHEALIHRVDAELTAGTRTDLDPALCADGVDEVLRIMFAGHPAWGTFTPRVGRTIRLRATDTGDTWLVTLGRFTGHDPEGDQDVDEADLGVAETDLGDASAATVSATAADLDCWLWHRPPVVAPQREGDQQVLDDLNAILQQPIN